MSLYTKFLKLIKPEGNEYYNIEHFNHNSELIDKKIEEHSTALTTIQQGATNEQKGIVQFGTEEGKALEGMMLARLAGAYGFGGDIQNTGVKNQNYIYFDSNTRKMYKCLNQNSDTSASVQNYIPVDNISLLDRLENLITFANYSLYDGIHLVSNNQGTLVDYLNTLYSQRKIPKTIYSKPANFNDLNALPLQNAEHEMLILYFGSLGIKAIITENTGRVYFISSWNNTTAKHIVVKEL